LISRTAMKSAPPSTPMVASMSAGTNVCTRGHGRLNPLQCVPGDAHARARAAPCQTR
jgi:hypothetical protein